jgi:FMN phosphatase YigB (HAD superfamily)
VNYNKKPLVGIIMGSSSDSRIMHGAAEILDSFNVKHDDQIISAHTLGSPKEHREFWELLSKTVQFSQEKSLFIDDNLTVLSVAQEYGIRHLLSIAKPDSQLPIRTSTEFFHVDDFRELFTD